MKKSLLELSCCLLPLLFLACGGKSAIKASEQAETEAIKKASELIADKKYESAFKLLDSLDPGNSKPNIVLLKEDIALNYFVTSFMHRAFALKDIDKSEDIMNYRGSEGEFNMRLFQVDSILENLIKIYPDNCKLYKGLGYFYYEVSNKYSEKWFKDDSELLTLVQTNFQKTIDGGCADYLPYYALGIANLRQEKHKESIPYFLKSIEMNNENAESHYNLAYAYLYAGDWQNVLKYAKNALALYTDPTYKSDAARMLGYTYEKLKDDKNALESYELANKIDPENYHNLKNLLDLYVKTGNEKTEEITKIFFGLAPDNPTIYNDLDEIYHGSNKEKDLIAFYKSQFSAFKDNEKVEGALNFYLGEAYIEMDKKIAEEYFLKSKEVFSKVFPKDHQVFGVIEENLKQCK
ncbi:MAG: tetratricopeptide repeat protein [Fibromonadaceae bacterium]|jgi:tetratricopeptide (TPR) repeat protein|nr:tetratricopeptide repeat protein [Fibromonadaceae bacterium]